MDQLHFCRINLKKKKKKKRVADRLKKKRIIEFPREYYSKRRNMKLKSVFKSWKKTRAPKHLKRLIRNVRGGLVGREESKVVNMYVKGSQIGRPASKWRKWKAVNGVKMHYRIAARLFISALPRRRSSESRTMNKASRHTTGDRKKLVKYTCVAYVQLITERKR